MNDSILTSIKKRLGIGADCDHFDEDIIMDINSVLAIMAQLGVESSEGYFITDGNNEWSEFLQDDNKLEFVKTYVYLKVKLMFDPPQQSSLIEAINRQITELEWRIFVQTDSKSN